MRSYCLFLQISGCRSSLGIETSGVASNSQLTASSGTASKGKLYKPSTAWCSVTKSNTEYLQVDLKGLVTLTGITTQAHPTRQQWTKTFNIKYSFDNSEWFDFKDGESSVKVRILHKWNVAAKIYIMSSPHAR